MYIVAYCRVSTDKEDWLNSLEAQKEFFSEYTKRMGNTLVRLYAEEGYGAAKIANMLNEKGLKTKRNCKWSQNAPCCILTNEIYTGKIINGKQEVSDFLTGQRKMKQNGLLWNVRKSES